MKLIKMGSSDFIDKASKINSIEDIFAFSDDIGFTSLMQPIEYQAEQELKRIEQEIYRCLQQNNLVQNIVEQKKRVKNPPSILFRLMLLRFDMKKIYDLIGFRLLTTDIETCRAVYDKITGDFPVPEQYSHYWDHEKWFTRAGARDILSKPKPNGYRSFDYFNTSEGVIFEMQSRPERFESENKQNYQEYKKRKIKMLKDTINLYGVEMQDLYHTFHDAAASLDGDKGSPLLQMLDSLDIHNGDLQDYWLK
jgi:hypothetical protein